MKLRLPARIGLVRLSLLAVLVGLITGFGAILFRTLIAIIHNFAFAGTFATDYDAKVFTPASPWGPFIILAPVVGGLFVTFLIQRFAPEARGPGVSEVMDAIYYKEGRIRPVVALVKSLASAISIGTGAAVGREGPIIQIGASLGSTLGQIITMSPWQRITLVAAGAGSGIAATFNTPIGGLMFAVELVLPEVSTRTFLPVALATGTATFIGRMFLGINPAFEVPPVLLIDTQASLAALSIYAMIGVAGGLGATAFIRALSLAERSLERIANPYMRNVVGMTIVGTLMYTLLLTTGHYYVEGVGYAGIQAVLGLDLTAPALLILLFAAKLFATSTSLGAGASGGIFSPSLFMGAMLGGSVGALALAINPELDLNVATCAIVGMAAMVGGGTGAAMTAVIMNFEMTRDYDLVMPSIIAVAIAVGVRRVLSPENIYTIKLTGRRHFVPKALHANMFMVRRASDVMERNVVVLPAETDFDAFLRKSGEAGGMRHVVVTKGNRIAGYVRVNMGLQHGLQRTHTGITLGDVAQRNFTIAAEDEVMFDVVTRMARRKAGMAIITAAVPRPRSRHVVGIVSREHIGDSVADNLRGYG